MSFTYLRSDALRNVHARLIQTYGGLQGIRDENALEAAVARPRQLHHYTGEERIGVTVASLAWALLRSHPFTDGNKRVALAALVMGAELNGHRLVCDEAEETAMVLRAAALLLTEEEWTAWADRVVVPK